MLLEPPRTLPVDHLSASSLALYLQCPLKWKQRQIEHRWEPTSGSAIAGTAVHRAEGANFQQKIQSGLDMPVRDVLDSYSDEFDARRELDEDRRRVDWGDERPGHVKDTGARVLGLYHDQVARLQRPLSVERKFIVHPADVDWTFEGYFDLEGDDNGLKDYKVRGKTRGIVSAEEAASDIQVTSNLFARRAEGNSASGFEFHNLVRAEDPTPRHVLITPAQRTTAELDAFLGLLFEVAAEISWRAEYEIWTPAPPSSWWCSSAYCGFWSTCPRGGALGSPSPRPRPARKPGPSRVLGAVNATLRRDGTTTAKRVADYLGISVRSASSAMAAHPRVVSGPATKGAGRNKHAVSGPRVYSVPADQEPAAA